MEIIEVARAKNEKHLINGGKELAYYPSLKTILMVEEAIQKAGEWPNKRQLWLSLPKGVMYQKLLIILDYLEYSNKIVIAKTGEIVWVWNPKLMEGRVKKGMRSFEELVEKVKKGK